MDTMTVQNDSGQVVSFSFDLTNPSDVDRKAAVEQRVKRGELEVVKASVKSTSRRKAAKSLDADVRDEKGDLLTSIHGGGLDPEHITADARPALAAVEKLAENAAKQGTSLSATTEAVAVTVKTTSDAAGGRKAKSSSE